MEEYTYEQTLRMFDHVKDRLHDHIEQHQCMHECEVRERLAELCWKWLERSMVLGPATTFSKEG